ncbi:MAG: hypothetical protein IJK48_06370 [Bacteroidales bacterium]|nr:hypothetical protein [Bacteroidales bacterium]
MRKVIVFRVENVLVNGYDEKKGDELNGRKFVKRMVGDELFEEEFVKGNGKMKEVMSCSEMIEKMLELERRFEDEGDVMRKYWMRDVRRRVEEREEGKDKRLVEMRKKYSDEGFGKKLIGIRNDLMDLERICEVTGSRMVFVSEVRKRRVENLLYNNGLRRIEVESDLGFLEGMDEKEYVVFDNVEDLRDLWVKVGLRRN